MSWLVCAFALGLVLLETLDLLPVQKRCALSFSSVWGARGRTVSRSSLLWLPSFQISPETDRDCQQNELFSLLNLTKCLTTECSLARKHKYFSVQAIKECYLD